MWSFWPKEGSLCRTGGGGDEAQSGRIVVMSNRWWRTYKTRRYRIRLMSVLLEDPGRIMEINEEGSSFGKWMIVQRSIMRKKGNLTKKKEDLGGGQIKGNVSKIPVGGNKFGILVENNNDKEISLLDNGGILTKSDDAARADRKSVV